MSPVPLFPRFRPPAPNGSVPAQRDPNRNAYAYCRCRVVGRKWLRTRQPSMLGVLSHHLKFEMKSPPFEVFFGPTFHAKSPKPLFGSFNGFPPDSRRLSIYFDRLSVISISFSQLQSVSIGQNRRNLLSTGRWGKQHLINHLVDLS